MLVDTSALFALLDADDGNHPAASKLWNSAATVPFVTHAYVISETIALVRKRLGWAGVDVLVDELLPSVGIEMVDHGLHDTALARCRSERGGVSFVDQVSIEFARQLGIEHAFAFNRDLSAAGLAFPPAGGDVR
ncbi:MAG TPA: PIN domain-containing protein [Candidatus Saccharimonadales bacterium]|nr:PIN domain-containing protein [Candidatus Saccharimonadales bacterium]